MRSTVSFSISSAEAKQWLISDVDFEKNKQLFAALAPVNGLADKNKAQQVHLALRAAFPSRL
jgi:hypothetical protein